MPKNVDGFGLVIPKLRENAFLETFVKLLINWQWQLNY